MKPGRWRGETGIRTALVCLSLAAGTSLIEAGLRLATGNTVVGMPIVGQVPLLPYRPPSELVREWVSRNANPESQPVERYVVFDPDLGWTIEPNSQQGDYYSNGQGIRVGAPVEYAAARPDDQLRIVAVGDSFVHADEVSYDQSWGAVLGRGSDPIQVVNLGVPAYGTDQSYLRWIHDGRQFETDFVLLGIYPEDICRNLTTNRYFMQPRGGFHPKPRFTVQAGRLVLVPAMAPQEPAFLNTLCDPGAPTEIPDYWRIETEREDRVWYGSRLLRFGASAWQMHRRSTRRLEIYTSPESEGNQLTLAIASALSDSAREAGAQPLVVVFPLREFLDANDQFSNLALVNLMERAAIPMLDLHGPFGEAQRAESPPDLFLASGHLTARGNEIAASEIRRFIQSEPFSRRSVERSSTEDP